MGIINRFTSYSRRKQLLIAMGIIIGLVGAYIAWWLISPYFLPGKTLNEDISQYDDVLGSNVTILSTGQFVKIDNSHQGSGEVRIVQTNDGELKLVFVDVDISNGPALKVYLSSKPSFSGTGDSAGDYVDLGDLRANIGNFTMDIPSNTDLSSYQSVLIWCEPFFCSIYMGILKPTIVIDLTFLHFSCNNENSTVSHYSLSVYHFGIFYLNFFGEFF